MPYEDDRKFPAFGPAGTLDVTDSLGSFFFLSKQGRLFTLKGVRIGPDFATLTPRVHISDFDVLHPLISRIRVSNISLVIHPGKLLQTYFVMEFKTGATKKTVKVFEETIDVISGALTHHAFPVLLLGDLEQAVVLSRKKKSPLTVPVRFLEFKTSVPQHWARQIRDLFLLNADLQDSKLRPVEEKLASLRNEIRQSILENYMTKCTWLDAQSGSLGRLTVTERGLDLLPFDPHEAQYASFLRVLQRGIDGKILAHHDIGDLIPTSLRSHPWASPTLHIRNERLRTAYKLSEYYSVYGGFKALRAVGAPVLLYRGSNPLESTSQVRFLRVANIADELAEVSIRSFTGRELVWSEVLSQCL